MHPRTPPQRNSNIQSPLPTTDSSRYLSPIQEQRIVSWRNLTDSSNAPSISNPKSAPASLSLSKAASSSTCACCAKTSCSCSTSSPRSSAHRKSYYSNTKRKSASTLVTSAAPMTPSTAYTPITTAVRTTPVRPDKRGLPANEQVMAHKVGTGLAQQYGQAPIVPLPEPALAAPPLKSEPPPRIAGARDPVTQN